MPSHIIKPNRDEDIYVEWSSIVEAPTFMGSRAEVIEYGRRQGWVMPATERLDRADATSSSAQWYEPSWDEDEAYIFMQMGTFVRSDMTRVTRAYMESGESAVQPLLTPFEDDEQEPIHSRSTEDE